MKVNSLNFRTIWSVKETTNISLHRHRQVGKFPRSSPHPNESSWNSSHDEQNEFFLCLHALNIRFLQCEEENSKIKLSASNRNYVGRWTCKNIFEGHIHIPLRNNPKILIWLNQTSKSKSNYSTKFQCLSWADSVRECGNIWINNQ